MKRTKVSVYIWPKEINISKSVKCSNSLCKENAYIVFQEGGGGLGTNQIYVYIEQQVLSKL